MSGGAESVTTVGGFWLVLVVEVLVEMRRGLVVVVSVTGLDGMYV